MHKHSGNKINHLYRSCINTPNNQLHTCKSLIRLASIAGRVFCRNCADTIKVDVSCAFREISSKSWRCKCMSMHVGMRTHVVHTHPHHKYKGAVFSKMNSQSSPTCTRSNTAQQTHMHTHCIAAHLGSVQRLPKHTQQIHKHKTRHPPLTLVSLTLTLSLSHSLSLTEMPT